MATYISIETDKKISYQIDGGDKQTMFANIEDDGYPEPTGTITITQNGTGIDVKDYAEADVNVPGGGYPEPTGTITITQNGTGIDVKDYAEADVNVPTYPEPTGTKQISITQNGTTTENVKDYASAEIMVNVPQPQYKIETGSFEVAESTKTYDITHNLGVVPNFVFLYPIDVTTESETYLIMSEVLVGDAGQYDWKTGTDSNTRTPNHGFWRGVGYNVSTHSTQILDGLPKTVSNVTYSGLFTNTYARVGGFDQSNSAGKLHGTYGYIVGYIPFIIPD